MSNSSVEETLNVFDLRQMAKKRLPKWLFEFVDRGTEDELALRNNRAVFERIKPNSYTAPFSYNRKNTTAVMGKPGWFFGVLMRIRFEQYASDGFLKLGGDSFVGAAGQEQGVPAHRPCFSENVDLTLRFPLSFSVRRNRCTTGTRSCMGW
jgi:hypothetical protein